MSFISGRKERLQYVSMNTCFLTGTLHRTPGRQKINRGSFSCEIDLPDVIKMKDESKTFFYISSLLPLNLLLGLKYTPFSSTWGNWERLNCLCMDDKVSVKIPPNGAWLYLAILIYYWWNCKVYKSQCHFQFQDKWRNLCGNASRRAVSLRCSTDKKIGSGYVCLLWIPR